MNNEMIAHKFTTRIGKSGEIKVPDYLKKYFSNPVEVIMLFPEKKDVDGKKVSNFYKLIESYNKIEEPELQIDEMYKSRLSNNERQFDFT